MSNILPSSIGALVVAAIALFPGCFHLVLSLTIRNQPWNIWGSVLSYVVFQHGLSIFFQYHLNATPFNRVLEHIQVLDFVLLAHACYEFTVHFLGIRTRAGARKILIIHAVLALMIWWPGLIIKSEFIYRHFLWLSSPLVELPLTLAGKALMVYLICFGIYILSLWYKNKQEAGKEGTLFMGGAGFLIILCVHDLFCAFGFESVQYLNIYGFLGMFAAIVGIATMKYIRVYKEVEFSARALEISRKQLENKVRERTDELVRRNKELQNSIDRLEQGERQISILSDQTEQFSLAAASMLTIRDEKEFFRTVSHAIVKYSDYNRVIISLFKSTHPFRDIIGYAGLDAEVIQRLRGVEMPAGQYDHVFEQGHKIGRQSYYIPHVMKDILKQEATVYGSGPEPEKGGGWHPEDNLFVKMINENGEFIGVISVDESKSGGKPTRETVRPLEIFSSLISQILLLKKEQEKNRQLEERLMQARRMESIGTLTGGIAHDFNNILGIIIGNADLGLEKLSSSDSIRLDLETIKTAANRAAGIVGQLLSFGKNNAADLRPVRVGRVLEEAVGLMKSTMPATIEIKNECSAESAVIMADPVQVNQVFLNLGSNAAQSMIDQTGRIIFSCIPVEVVREQIRDLPDLNPGTYVKIAISDSGAGIEPGILDRIFEPYFTTKDFGKGSGIGLAVVYGIVKNHKGFVTVNSRRGRGTTFEIYFPLVDKAPEDPEDQTMPLETGNLERVLNVDDDPMLLNMMGKMLHYLGYHVTDVSDPVRALEMFKKDPDGFDLVITDMTMPRMSGKVLAQEIIKTDPGKPVIICTGYNDTIQGKTARDLNVSALMMKPVRIHVLSRILKEVLDQ